MRLTPKKYFSENINSFPTTPINFAYFNAVVKTVKVLNDFYIYTDIYILNSIVLYKLYYVYIFRYLYIAFKVCQGHEKTVPLSLDKKRAKNYPG